MKTVVFAAVAALAGLSPCADTEDFDPDEIILPDKGRIAIVSCIGDRHKSALDLAAKQFFESAYITVFVTNAVSFSFANAKCFVDGKAINEAVFVVDDSTLPMELAASMERWALVNVAALKTDSPSKEVLDSRVRRLVMRNAAMLAGALIPRSNTSLMCGAVSLVDIDKIAAEEVSLDILFNISRFGAKSGIVPGHKTSYRSACERDIAPKPVTEYQKKVWDEFHSLPKKPIKIKFDAKEGR